MESNQRNILFENQNKVVQHFIYSLTVNKHTAMVANNAIVILIIFYLELNKNEIKLPKKNGFPTQT